MEKAKKNEEKVDKGKEEDEINEDQEENEESKIRTVMSDLTTKTSNSYKTILSPSPRKINLNKSEIGNAVNMTLEPIGTTRKKAQRENSKKGENENDNKNDNMTIMSEETMWTNKIGINESTNIRKK